MKTIGPTFFQELQSAGVANLPFTWSPQGEFIFTTEATDLVPTPMTPEQVAAVLAVYDAHDPDAPAPLPMPTAVSRYQGREAMHLTPYGDPADGVSLFDAVETLLARPETPAYYVRAWDELQVFEPDSPMLMAIADEMGLTADDLRDLFLLAASLRA